MTGQELTGKPVMLRPDLWDRHAGPAGVIGKITRADIDRDDFFVDYGGSREQLHSADALLVLKDTGDIYDHLHQQAHKLSPDDFRNLKSVALLLDYGTDKHLLTALALVRDHPDIHFAAAERLDQVPGIMQQKNQRR